VGRNLARSWGLVGIELNGRFGGESFSDSRIITTPASIFSAVSGTAKYDYKYRNDIGLHASLRAGATFNDLLVFAKAGAGVSRIRETFAADEASLTIVRCPTVFSSCTTSTALPAIGTAQAEFWLPSLLFGLGAEQNWGPMFARAGVDFEAFNHPSTNVTAANIRGTSGPTAASATISWATRAN
jgi:hypothetical protein